MTKTYIISELCGQWGGSMSRAKEMIDQSKTGGANAVKVQLWDTYKMPGENREKWEYLVMSKQQFFELKNYSQQVGIDFFASPFDSERFNWVLDADLKINKIASSLLEWNFDLCKSMVSSGLKTFCSLGKWNKDVAPFENKNVEYFHCLAEYPHSEQRAISQMPAKLTGYSDHSIGIGACIEAASRGATLIEKHFTIDKTLPGPDHQASMNPVELLNFINKIRKTES